MEKHIIPHATMWLCMFTLDMALADYVTVHVDSERFSFTLNMELCSYICISAVGASFSVKFGKFP